MTFRFIEAHETKQHSEDLKSAREIRHEVFVIGQGVSDEIEQDGLDSSCSHLLAFQDARPVATMRMRETSEGVKFERIAVLEEFRGKGLGRAMVSHALELFKGGKVYLHSQDHAVRFYETLGFTATQERTIEADIAHVTMLYITS
ncbi:MAG: GNAT family N-acetyltransferase [Sphaerochaetaceae bacterium]|nr:GNAT family N-acetyltransferase [Sphaerochaetaceae bacterium]